MWSIVLTIMNIYGPNSGRAEFWNRLLSSRCHRMDRFILAGDLNLSLGEAETWGPNAMKDPLSDFFLRLIDEKGFIDLTPTHLKPTWSNKRVGDECVSKILDRCLINESIL